jgi:hypothetical protein
LLRLLELESPVTPLNTHPIPKECPTDTLKNFSRNVGYCMETYSDSILRFAYREERYAIQCVC